MKIKKTKTFALHLTKGGVGKTTTLVNIGFCLRSIGFKILFVDADPQYSLSEYFPIKTSGKNLNNLLLGEKIDPTEITTNVDLIEGSQQLHSTKFSKTLLLESLELYKGYYDFILIDTSPALSNITLCAMHACDKIFLPVEASLMGLQAINKTYLAMGESLKEKLGGLFLTRYKRQTISSKETEKELRRSSKSHVFKTYIREASQVNNSHMLRKPVIEAYPTCALAQEYRDLTNELLAILNK